MEFLLNPSPVLTCSDPDSYLFFEPVRADVLTRTIAIGRELRALEADSNVTLRSKVVDLIGLNRQNEADEVGTVC